MVTSPCSEFPNDNPALHEGSIFGNEATVGACEVISYPPPAARSDEPAPEIEVVEAWSEVDEPELEGSGERKAAPEGELWRAAERAHAEHAHAEHAGVVSAESGFTKLVTILHELARELGGDDAQRTLDAALEGHTPLPPKIAYASATWRALLEGDDSTTLPELMLDEWAAGLLAALFDGTAEELRRRVRSAGIAAFGVLEVDPSHAAAA